MTSTVRRAVESAIREIGQGLYGVACSGGADSMALADATIDVAGAHNVVLLVIDHGLQPTNTQPVVEWARARGAAAVVERVRVERRASLEAAARDARYAALSELADRLGCIAILLGHTARDQAETVLMRILRGTGPAGLAGIPVRRASSDDASTRDASTGGASTGNASSTKHRRTSFPGPTRETSRTVFFRPLLAIAREDIDAYVRERGLPIWDDPMNDDRSLMRTRIRHDVLPALRRENPQLDSALVRLADSAREWLDVIDEIAAPLATLPIDCAALRAHPPAIRKRAISIALESCGIDHDATHLDDIDAIVLVPARGEIGIDLPGARIVRSYERLDVATAVEAAPLVAPDGPYELRVWQAGDRMRPARLKGRSRKLSDLYVDQKVPRSLRATARVVIRVTDGVIVWAEHLGTAFEEPETVVPKPVQMGGSF
jgi:tRNA(Ile)-lysidine synthase